MKRVPVGIAWCCRPERHTREQGLSTFELMVTLATVTVVLAMSVPSTIAARRAAMAEGAAHRLATIIDEARALAIARGRSVGLTFRQTTAGYAISVHEDGNGNGLRTADLASGADPLIRGPFRLADDYPGSDLAIVQTVPDVAGGPPLPAGSSPVRCGSSGILVLTAHGTATSSTVYLGTPDGRQFAVRVLGATARSRLLEFDRGGRRWRAR